MRALFEIFRFELGYHLRSALFWLAGLVFFLLAFGAVTTDAVVIGGAIGNVNRNAPFVIMQFLLIMSAIGVFVTTAFVAGAVVRDHEQGTDDLFFSTPVRPGAYLLGRFGGAFAVSVLIFVWVVLAVTVGSLMPWLEPERVGPFRTAPYLYSMGVIVLPNILLTSALFFGLATLTRSMMGTYVGVVAFFVGNLISQVLLSDVEDERLAALLDPFGIGAFQVATQYWTTAERNARLLPLEGAFLENRILWLGVAALVLALTFWRFSFTASPGAGAVSAFLRKIPLLRRIVREPTGAGPEDEEGAPAGPEPGPPEPVPAAPRSFSSWTARRQLLHRAGFEVGRVVRSVPFGVILALGALNFIGAAIATDSMFGTPVWPRTHLMLSAIDAGFLLFALIILTFYSGELVWRDRSIGVDGMTDALPVPDSVLWGAKLVALLVISVGVLGVAVAAAVGYQLWTGFTDIEPLLYLKGAGGRIGALFALLAVLALFTQVATNHKFAGFGLMALYFVSLPVLDALDFDHNLYKYAQAPPAPYSDMNGYGHFVEPLAWFGTYWGFVALGLLVVVHLFWVRGEDARWRSRLREARRRLGRRPAVALAVAVLGAAGTGGWIYYNTDVLNDYLSGEEQRDRQADFEERYSAYDDAPQPKIVSVYAEVDIHPYRRALDVRGTYRVRNKESVPVDSLHLAWDASTIDAAGGELEMTVPDGRRVHDDPELGWRTYELDAPMAPGEERDVEFRVRVRNPGFVNHGSDTDLVYNGTFVSNVSYFPHIGYNDAFELTDPSERRERGLPPVERMPPLEDSTHYDENYLTPESDWVDFETVVSTAGDQVALAPGYLQREWTEGGRRYFHYRMDAPILGLWAYLSGRWEVRRDRWNDVELAVYHHPAHTYNVDRMIEAMKASLDYYTENFGPYQHTQLRIVEFPRYASFAQSLPTTIPFSESIGFIARLEDPNDIDYPFYVTAHEVAHQWWAHQVMGAGVQGATVTSETMSQYSALMVQEKEYGPRSMRRFLRYELDAYLEGRGGELVEELPLYRVENQPYIHYRKGSLATYALRDYIGEDAFNRAMRSYVTDRRFTGPPYTTSLEYLDYLAAEVPAEHAGAVEDLFRTITLWEWRAEGAEAVPTDGGRWRVRLDYRAEKLRADGEGNETPVPVDDLVDVAVFGPEGEETPAEGRVLFLEKRRVSAGEGTIEVVVDERPERAGIDPFNKLVDRNPENNVTDVEGGS